MKPDQIGVEDEDYFSAVLTNIKAANEFMVGPRSRFQSGLKALSDALYAAWLLDSQKHRLKDRLLEVLRQRDQAAAAIRTEFLEWLAKDGSAPCGLCDVAEPPHFEGCPIKQGRCAAPNGWPDFQFRDSSHGT